MSFEAPVIETERLLLTWPSVEQVDQYYNDIIGTDMFETIQWEGPSGPHELHDYWNMNFKQDPKDLSLDLNIAVIKKDSNEYVGGASLRPVHADPSFIDLGYAFAPKFHGQGFATETVKALVNEAFSFRKAERVFAHVFSDNSASERVVEKAGFLFEGTLRRSIFKRGRWLDYRMLAITRPDWEENS